jgi:tetratricopeptide (TPR) repeat protein
LLTAGIRNCRAEGLLKLVHLHTLRVTRNEIALKRQLRIPAGVMQHFKKDTLTMRFNTILLFLILSLRCYAQFDNNTNWQMALDFHAKKDYYNSLIYINKLDSTFITCEMTELKGDCFHKIGNYNYSIKFLELTKSKCNLSFESYVNLGDSYFKIEKIDSAINNFRKAYIINSKNSELNFNLGLCHYILNDFDLAKNFLKQSIQQNTKELDSYDLLMQIYNESSQFDSSLYVIATLKTHIDKARVKLMEAYIYGHKKDYKKCIQILNQVLKMDIDDKGTKSNAYITRYQIYCELGDKDKACNDYLMIKEIDPDYQIDNAYNCK